MKQVPALQSYIIQVSKYFDIVISYKITTV